jgi:hypothetical protein
MGQQIFDGRRLRLPRTALIDQSVQMSPLDRHSDWYYKPSFFAF